ncbi:MAG: lysophospholipid acyltransferase family protein [Pseudomonadota bacterium]
MLLLLRSLLFNTIFYAGMLFWGIGLAPLAMISRDWSSWICKSYVTFTFRVMKLICGLSVEVRGAVPQGDVLIAAKHHSFLDILILADALPNFKFIMKKELKWAPVIGFYAKQLGCPPVDRGKKAQAMTQMVGDLEEGESGLGQVIIYPQGTRVKVGDKVPYKMGAAVIYNRFDLPCVPVASNVGVFWGRLNIVRRPGVAVMEFLDPIPPGLEQREMLQALEDAVETRSDELIAEAKASLAQ